MLHIFAIQAPKAPSHVNAPKLQVDQYYKWWISKLTIIAVIIIKSSESYNIKILVFI